MTQIRSNMPKLFGKTKLPMLGGKQKKFKMPKVAKVKSVSMKMPKIKKKKV